ncbi:MAG: hypothetical protein IKO42_05420 [Opitutales bacterium]|nr:hypothetical protein [Opitutales bacterium]
MSGLVAWSSRAKRKPVKKAAGAKPNAHKQRALAARRRKENERQAKAAQKARKAEIAKVVAEQNA